MRIGSREITKAERQLAYVVGSLATTLLSAAVKLAVGVMSLSVLSLVSGAYNVVLASTRVSMLRTARWSHVAMGAAVVGLGVAFIG